MTNIYFWGKVISPTFQKSICSKNTSTIVSVHTEEIIKNVECGSENAFLLTDQDQLYAFGSNEDGQMGLSFNPHKNLQLSRVFVPTKTKIVSVSCGWHHTLILDQLGCLFSSGRGSQGAIGQNSRENSYGFKQIMTGVRKVSAGLDHSLAIKGNKVYGWGNTQDGQLGVHSKKKILTPKELNVYPCDEIFAGTKYSIFVTVRGVYGCGMNNNYQLGLGHNKDIHYPKYLELEDQIVKIWGGNYCFAKNKNGEVYIWGTGAFGVFKYPTKIEFFEGFDNLSLGLNFGIIEKNQRIYAWGSNNFGQLGSESIQIKDYAYECLRLSSLDLALFACGKNFTVGISYGDEAQLQKTLNTQCAKDQVIEDFYGDEDFDNQKNSKLFKQSLYSSFGSNTRPKDNTNMFNQSTRTNQHPNLASSMKRSSKPTNCRLSLSQSQQEKSISDQTVKRMTSVGLKNCNQSHQRVEQQASYSSEIQKLAAQLSQLKLQIRERSKRNHSLDQQNWVLKQFIRESLFKYNKNNYTDQSKFEPEDLKREYHSINELVEGNPYLKSMLGGINVKNTNQTKTKLERQVIEDFGSKLRNLKLILQQVVQNCQSGRNSIC